MPCLTRLILHVVADSIRVRGDALKTEALSIGREHLLEDLRDIFVRSKRDLVQRSSYEDKPHALVSSPVPQTLFKPTLRQNAPVALESRRPVDGV